MDTALPTEINGWQVTSDAGSVTLTKDAETITATYGHDDHELALDHAVAQAWATDKPEDAARLAGGDPTMQWAAIVRWTGGTAGTRFGHAREGDIAAADAAAPPSAAPSAVQVDAFVAAQPAADPTQTPEPAPVAPASTENGAQ